MIVVDLGPKVKACPRMVKKRNPALEQRRRQQLAETAWMLLATGSHRTLTLERVAREAGVSKGMLTYYFCSKDELVLAAIHMHYQLQEQVLLAIVEDDSLSVSERLERLIAVALPDRSTAELQLRFMVEVWSFAKVNPEAMDLVRAAYLRFRQHCGAMIEIGVEKGYVTAADRPWVNVALNALIDGLSFQLVIDESLDVELLRRRTLELVDGMLAPKR